MVENVVLVDKQSNTYVNFIVVESVESAEQMFPECYVYQANTSEAQQFLFPTSN